MKRLNEKTVDVIRVLVPKHIVYLSDDEAELMEQDELLGMLCELWDDGRFTISFLGSLSEFGEEVYDEVVQAVKCHVPMEGKIHL